jgi:hypothetical protein
LITPKAMKRGVSLILVAASLGGCATGYATDWFREQPAIVNPQLIRFGMDVTQARCVSQRLATEMRPQGLRRFQERAAGVRQGISRPDRLTPRDLRAVANSLGDQLVPRALAFAYERCGVSDDGVAVQAEAAEAPAAPAAEERVLAPVGPDTVLPPGAIIAPAAGERAGGTNAGAVSTATGAISATWLNLGQAGSGQQIAIDAASIGQDAGTRTAWFRMTDPDTGARTPNQFRLRIDCAARTVTPLARRQVSEAGAVTDYRDYDTATDPPQAVEAGTVLEIAYLSMCT